MTVFYAFLSDFFRKVIYQGVMSTSRVWLDRESFSVLWTTVSGTIFLYFNLKQKTFFPNNVGHAYSINKGCNLLSTHLLSNGFVVNNL